MIKFDDIIREQIKQHNLNYAQVPGHPYKFSIFGGFRSGRTWHMVLKHFKNISSNVTGEYNGRTKFPYKLLLSDRQVLWLCKDLSNSLSAN